MKMLFKLFIGFGVFLLIGTAGASDVNYIAVKQILVQIMISFLTIGVGLRGMKKIDIKERKRNRSFLTSPQITQL